jgi:hypothetical protein
VDSKIVERLDAITHYIDSGFHGTCPAGLIRGKTTDITEVQRGENSQAMDSGFHKRKQFPEFQKGL